MSNKLKNNSLKIIKINNKTYLPYQLHLSYNCVSNKSKYIDK